MPLGSGRQAAWLLSAFGVTVVAGLPEEALASLVLVTWEQR